MRVMIINGSPKKKLSMSRYIQKTIKVMLGKTDIIECQMRTPKDIPPALEKMDGIEALVIAAPLYIDGIPSNVMTFLQKAEQECKDKQYHFNVYAITNNGFIEGHQSEVNLAQYQCWAEKSGLIWGGGIGIGGGVMLGVYTIALPIALLQLLINSMGNLALGLPPITSELLLATLKSMGLFLFFSSGMFWCEARLARHIKKQKVGDNMYTRFLIPSCLFLMCADLFMLILSIIQGGFFRNLFHREQL